VAGDLVRPKVDLIVTAGGTPAALAAKSATSMIPIVFTNVGDPVGVGLVATFDLCRIFILRGFTIFGVLLCGIPAASLVVGADIEKKIQIAGIERSYIMHLPPNALDGHDMPLVVVLHGGGGDAQIAARQTHFDEEADRESFVVAYPNGTDRFRPLMNLIGKRGFLTWNAGGCCGYAMEHNIDDVGFLRAVVAEIERDHAIDHGRVYAAGMSNGGMMVYRLACEVSDVFAAVGVVSGGLVTHPCAPHAPVSVIHFHGTDDQYVPINGGVGRKSLTGTAFPPVRDTILFWVSVDECHAQPQVSRTPKGVLELDYHECRAGTAVTHYIIEGGEHAWPDGDRISAILDPPPTAISATPVMWRFFAAHPKM
jgi:polyhydroxybutyrate depolymerase